MSMRTAFESPSEPIMIERLLDSKQAAAIVRVHPKTLQRYARQGVIVGIRIGKHWRFRASDLVGHGEQGKSLDAGAPAK